LHDGRPTLVRNAEWGSPLAAWHPSCNAASGDPGATLLKILGSYSVCSKEWVIRQYDHEVQGGSVVKPLVGVMNDGPSDAAVIMPVLGSWAGAAIGCGMNPRYGEHDPYWMAAAAIDEALRNVGGRGGRPEADRHPRQLLLGQRQRRRGAWRDRAGPPKRVGTWRSRSARRSSAARTA